MLARSDSARVGGSIADLA